MPGRLAKSDQPIFFTVKINVGTMKSKSTNGRQLSWRRKLMQLPDKPRGAKESDANTVLLRQQKFTKATSKKP